MRQMISLAQRQGFHVEFLPLTGFDGLLMPGRCILVNSGITERRQREAIAHELGHAHYGHSHGALVADPAVERQADLYAARLLISPAEYALAEALHPSPGAIAAELGVSKYLVSLWQDHHAPQGMDRR